MDTESNSFEIVRSVCGVFLWLEDIEGSTTCRLEETLRKVQGLPYLWSARYSVGFRKRSIRGEGSLYFRTGPSEKQNTRIQEQE